MKISEEELTASLERTRKGCSLANVLPETVDYIKGAKEDGLIQSDLDKLEDIYNRLMGSVKNQDVRDWIIQMRTITLKLIKENEDKINT